MGIKVGDHVECPRYHFSGNVLAIDNGFAWVKLSEEIYISSPIGELCASGIKVGDQVWWVGRDNAGSGEVVGRNDKQVRVKMLNGEHIWIAICNLERGTFGQSSAPECDDDHIRKIVREELKKGRPEWWPWH